MTLRAGSRERNLRSPPGHEPAAERSPSEVSLTQSPGPGIRRAQAGGLVSAPPSEQVQETATFLLLLGSLVAATLFHGAFFTREQIAMAAILGAALINAIPIRRVNWSRVGLPLMAAGLLAGWALVRGAVGGSLSAGAREALLPAEVGTVVVLCLGLDPLRQRQLSTAALGLGVFVSIVGWIGVAWRITPWALPNQGLWRAASTLTYANATAAVLVPLSLVALALFSERPRSMVLGLTVSIFMMGSAATLSRAAALAFVVGLAVLALTRGLGVVRAVLKPLAGAALIGVGLLPSASAASPPRPALAVLGLLGGLGLTAVLIRVPRRRWAVIGIVAVLFGGAIAGTIGIRLGTIRAEARRIWHIRATVVSEGRSHASDAAFQMVKRHPLIGVGPGQAVLRWKDQYGGLRMQQFLHDEYLQVLAELGAIGLLWLIAFMIGLAGLLWRGRTGSGGSALWAGVLAACAAAAVQAGLDFVWHIPVVPLTVAVLIGLAIRSVQPAGQLP
jgi:O-Antigen ligase